MATSTLMNSATLTAILGMILAGLVPSRLLAQPSAPLDGDVRWRKEYGSGPKNLPGRSRILPPAGQSPFNAQLNPPANRPHGMRTDSPYRRNDSKLDHIAADPRGGQRSPPLDETDAWWNEDAQDTIVDPSRYAATRSVSPHGDIIESTQILAIVGNEPVLAGDLFGRINELLEPHADQLSQRELDEQRWQLVKRMLPSAIEAKMVYLDFSRNMKPEQIAAIQKSIFEQFDEKQLPKLVEQAKVKSAAQLEAKMRSLGSSLEKTRRSFFEQVAAREMIRKKGQGDDEVTHDDLLAYYREHATEYEVKARARWEQLMARFSEFDNKQQAYQAIARMGNEVLRGAAFAAVARKLSQGPTADKGGQHDLTTQGSLVSDVLDKAIFSLPVGRLSRILEDEKGFHIIRVIERQDARRIPFEEAQTGFRDKIKQQRREKRIKGYLEQLHQETYVWNYFQDASQTAEGLTPIRR